MKRPSSIALAVLLVLTGAGWMIREQIRHQATAPPAEVRQASRETRQTQQGTDRPSRSLEWIARIVDPALHHARRLEVVRGLPDDLTNQEFEEFMDLIRGPMPTSFEAGDWHVVINEIMNVLRDDRFHFDGYARAMGGMVLDRAADPVIRDYAAQYLALSLERVSNDESPAGFPFVMETFFKVLSREDEALNGVTGTILMSLTALFETFEPDKLAPYRDRLGAVILALISGEREVSMSNRISAIQAAGRLGYRETLPVIRKLAAAEDTNRWVRLSSVAALGYFGQPQDGDLLVRLARDNPAMEPAARTALKSMGEKASLKTQ